MADQTRARLAQQSQQQEPQGLLWWDQPSDPLLWWDQGGAAAQGGNVLAARPLDSDANPDEPVDKNDLTRTQKYEGRAGGFMETPLFVASL